MIETEQPGSPATAPGWDRGSGYVLGVDLAEHHQWWKHQGGQELRRLLMDEWDPIGVKGAAGAADEYDGYRGPIADRLSSGASAREIAEYLSQVEREHMGLGSGRTADDLLPLSERLIDWYAASTSRWSQARDTGATS